jgi:hypothetical protein
MAELNSRLAGAMKQATGAITQAVGQVKGALSELTIPEKVYPVPKDIQVNRFLAMTPDALQHIMTTRGQATFDRYVNRMLDLMEEGGG